MLALWNVVLISMCNVEYLAKPRWCFVIALLNYISDQKVTIAFALHGVCMLQAFWFYLRSISVEIEACLQFPFLIFLNAA